MASGFVISRGVRVAHGSLVCLLLRKTVLWFVHEEELSLMLGSCPSSWWSKFLPFTSCGVRSLRDREQRVVVGASEAGV